jgi:hypothetical protein
MCLAGMMPFLRKSELPYCPNSPTVTLLFHGSEAAAFSLDVSCFFDSKWTYYMLLHPKRLHDKYTSMYNLILQDVCPQK